MKTVQVIDSHTEGEPTRVVVVGGPEPGEGSISEKCDRFVTEYDHFRSAVIKEPRGSEILVGALLMEPQSKECLCGVIFFNNVGVLGMCGHGTIGLMITLAHLERIQPGRHMVETPAGVVEAELHTDHSVTVWNVPSFREIKNLSLEITGGKTIHGDIAWGGNWFFLCEDHGFELLLYNQKELTDFTIEVRNALHDAGYPKVDHIELFSPPSSIHADSRNFVLCPGGVYDRSPCGTGTSAKLACLAEEGKLKPGQTWTQESITGTTFQASYEEDPQNKNRIIPKIRGKAFITAETTLFFDDQDPLGF